jgi:hypothetical protein
VKQDTYNIIIEPSLIKDNTFSEQQYEAIFAGILADDDINLEATLPKNFYLDYSSTQLINCFNICRHLWREGVDRKPLTAMVSKLYRQNSLSSEEQMNFKYIRAKFKHLRYAYALFDQRHKYPLNFHLLTAIMGSLQDAFKNEQFATMNRFALVLKLIVSKPVYAFITNAINQYQPSTTESFKQHLDNQLNFLASNIAKDQVTSKIFHNMRKVIGRQTAFYTTIKVLYPSQFHEQMFLYLSTINGMMGDFHDDLVSKKFNKQQNYNKDIFIIPSEIKKRLCEYCALYQKK